MKVVNSSYKKDPKITIIVPVYNVGTYLEQCLNSIVVQNFQEWECIIIDDGSTDNSTEICDRFALNNNRFKVIHQQNKGVSEARNIGLEIASAQYIAFIDSDDWIDSNYLEVLYNLINLANADAAQCGYVKEFTTFRRHKKLPENFNCIEGESVYTELLFKERLHGYMWGKLFRRNVISSLFPQGMIYEDFFVMTEWAKNIRKIVWTSECLYHYRMRKSSLNMRCDAKSQLDFITAITERADQLRKNIPEIFDTKSEQKYFYRYLLERAKLIARNESNPSLQLEALDKILEILSSRFPNPDKNVIGKKLWKRARLFNSDPLNFIRRMKLVHILDFHDKFCSRHLFP